MHGMETWMMLTAALALLPVGAQAASQALAENRNLWTRQRQERERFEVLQAGRQKALSASLTDDKKRFEAGLKGELAEFDRRPGRDRAARAALLEDQSRRRRWFWEVQRGRASQLYRTWRRERAELQVRQSAEREGMIRRHALADGR